jgi:hypothetical protein
METIESVINQMPSPILLRLGRRSCLTYNAVMHHDNRKEPHYFYNRETLREAISEAWEVGDWKQKRQIDVLIEAAGF